MLVEFREFPATELMMTGHAAPEKGGCLPRSRRAAVYKECTKTLRAVTSHQRATTRKPELGRGGLQDEARRGQAL